MNIANFVTLSRIILTPFLLWLMAENYWMYALWVFAIASTTDFLDGQLARRLNLQSQVGQFLDPIADKFLMVVVFLAFAAFSLLPNWIVILIISRELLMFLALLMTLYMGKPIAIQPIVVSKVNTLGQMFLSFVVLMDISYSIDFSFLVSLCTWLVAGSTIISAAVYGKIWVVHINRS